MENDSGDLDTRDPSGGHVAIPRRIPLWPFLVVVGLVVSSLVGIGTWAYALEKTQDEHGARLDAHDEFAKRVTAYMCMDCSAKGAYDCRYICGMER